MMTTTAMSSVSHAPTTLTPPSSSHGNDSSWTYSTDRLENSLLREKQSSIHTSSSRAPLVSQNGNPYSSNNAIAIDPTARKIASSDQLAKAARSEEAAHLASIFPVATNKEDVGPADGTLSKHYGKTVSSTGAVENMYSENPDDPNSNWIHRDKLAKIENEELQAAGFILPKGRSSGKARPHDKIVENGTRSRKNSKAVDIKAIDTTAPRWDLRLPEEVSANEYFIPTSGAKGGSRIPVAKTSPLPIREQHLERDAPVHKKGDGSPETNSLKYPKPRSRSSSSKADTTPPSKPTGSNTARRSATDSGSPKKKPAAGSRKPSAKLNPARPKTRSGSNKDSTNSTGQRPSTRNGELSGTAGSKPMEGDPPWMVSAYIPDPRLPPDQQLLPTVARRLQQEKWEREGKFGNIYDKEFRPLTEDGFPTPPEGSGPANTNAREGENAGPEWPLKEADLIVKTPSSPSKAGAYSTMPKIQDMHHMSPLPSPRSPLNQPTPRISTQQVVRVPEEPQEEEPPKKGCGCCIVM